MWIIEASYWIKEAVNLIAFRCSTGHFLPFLFQHGLIKFGVFVYGHACDSMHFLGEDFLRQNQLRLGQHITLTTYQVGYSTESLAIKVFGCVSGSLFPHITIATLGMIQYPISQLTLRHVIFA